MTGMETGGVVAVFGLAITLWIVAFARCCKLVHLWASANGLTLERRELHLLSRGPFASVTRTQLIWAVRVREKEGRKRDAWLKCGGPVFGTLFSRQMDVKWVDEGKSAFLDS
jgi:hypothetical protein